MCLQSQQNIHGKKKIYKVLKHQKCVLCIEGFSRTDSDDVFEAERAVTGEPLAFASATQVLSMGSFGVNVPLRQGTGAAGFVASLENKRRMRRSSKKTNLKKQGCNLHGTLCLLHGMGWSPSGISCRTVWSKPRKESHLQSTFSAISNQWSLVKLLTLFVPWTHHT